MNSNPKIAAIFLWVGEHPAGQLTSGKISNCRTVFREQSESFDLNKEFPDTGIFHPDKRIPSPDRKDISVS